MTSEGWFECVLPSDNRYDGNYITNAKEDAAQVCLERLESPTEHQAHTQQYHEYSQQLQAQQQAQQQQQQQTPQQQVQAQQQQQMQNQPEPAQQGQNMWQGYGRWVHFE